MKETIYIATFAGMLFRIEPDLPEVGTYLYVYHDGRCEFDYLQTSAEICMEFAQELWGVPRDSWIVDVYLTPDE